MDSLVNPGPGMVKGDRPCMQSDRVIGSPGQQQPGPIFSVAHNRAAASGKLGPQLVLPAGGWPQLNKGNLSQPTDNPGTALS